jgi:hypothetical protein
MLFQGKGSKHQHSVSLSEPLDTLIQPGKFYINNSVSFGVPEEFHGKIKIYYSKSFNNNLYFLNHLTPSCTITKRLDCLGEAVVAILALGAQEIQAMIADSSSCAVLGLLLRILFSPDIVAGGRDLAERLARTALECTQPSSDDVMSMKVNPAAVTLFYAMAGDRSGSYFLEAVVECCAVPLLVELLHGALKGSAKEYALDGSGNFVLQAVLKRLSSELERGETSGPELKALQGVTDAILDELTDTETFPELALSKGGVVLWLLEVARWSKCDSGNRDWAEVVSTGLISVWTNKGALQLPDVLADKLAPKAALDAIAASKIPQKKVKGRVVVDKDSAQLLIARLTGALLKLRGTAGQSKSAQPRTCELVAQAVFMLPLGTLQHVATSGPLSRAVLDTALDLYVGTDSADPKDKDKDKDKSKGKEIPNNAAQLLTNLSSLSADLADHFIGQHVLKRVFDKGSAGDKECIVTALDGAKEKLGRTKEGRNSLRITQAELFARKPDEWRALLRKQSAALDMLKEIEGGNTGARQVSSSSGVGGSRQRPVGFDKSTVGSYSSGYDGENNGSHSSATVPADEEQEVAGAGNRKRKRKRPGKKNSEETETGDDPSSSVSEPIHEVVKSSEKKLAGSTSSKTSVGGGAVSSIVKTVPQAAAVSHSGERNIDMKKIQRLRNAKVTSATSLGDEIERLVKKPSAK